MIDIDRVEKEFIRNGKLGFAMSDDLIAGYKQLQAENKHLKDKLKSAVGHVSSAHGIADKKIEQQQAEIKLNKDLVKAANIVIKGYEDEVQENKAEIKQLKKDSEFDTDNLIKHLTNELYYGDYEEYDDGEKTLYKYIDKNEINGRIKEAFKSLPKPPEAKK